MRKNGKLKILKIKDLSKKCTTMANGFNCPLTLTVVRQMSFYFKPIFF